MSNDKTKQDQEDKREAERLKKIADEKSRKATLKKLLEERDEKRDTFRRQY